MSDYYINLGDSYYTNRANNGESSSTPWGGTAGVNRAASVATAGDVIHLINADDPADNLDPDECWKVTVADTTGLSINDILSHNSTEVGIITCILSSTSFIVEIINGGFAVSNVLTPDGGASNYTVTNINICGIYLNEDYVNSGTWDSPITLRGEGIDNLAYINASNQYCAIEIGEINAWRLEYLKLDQAGTYGIYKRTTVEAFGWVIRNIEIDQAADVGFYNAMRFKKSSFSNIYCHDCGGSGLYGSPYACCLKNCRFSNNGSATGEPGLDYPGTYGSLYNCLIDHNGGNGIEPGSSVGNAIINCTLDNNGKSGVYLVGGGCQIYNCRLTNNAEYGINAHASTEDWQHSENNVFYNNTLGDIYDSYSIEDYGSSSSSFEHKTVEDDGYQDSSYLLKSNAIMRREDITLTGLDSLKHTAGINTSDKYITRRSL